jgi:septum site-determining protein MinC
MAGEAVTIRGTSEGVMIALGEGPLQPILEDLEARLAGRASFFLGGRVALSVGDRPLAVEQLHTIGELLERMGMTLWAVRGEHPTTEAAAQELGLETGHRTSTTPGSGAANEVSREELVGVVVRRTLRSGQAVRHTGHVIIIGDVNPGAEVLAGGDIVVWGKLRGIAHAGAMGDDDAVVCALQLMPSQIRIGSYVARPPDRARPPKVPEIASIQEDRIVVERWDQGQKEK